MISVLSNEETECRRVVYPRSYKDRIAISFTNPMSGVVGAAVLAPCGIKVALKYLKLTVIAIDFAWS